MDRNPERNDGLRPAPAKHSRVLLLSLDLDGHFGALSAGWEEVLGLKPHELHGASLFDWLHPDDWRAARESLRGDDFRSALRLRHASGDWGWFDIEGGRLIIGGESWVIAVARPRDPGAQRVPASESLFRDVQSPLGTILLAADFALLRLGDRGGRASLERSLKDIIRCTNRASDAIRHWVTARH